MPWFQAQTGSLVNSDHLQSIQVVQFGELLKIFMPGLEELSFTEAVVGQIKEMYGLDLKGLQPDECVRALTDHAMRSVCGHEGEVGAWLAIGTPILGHGFVVIGSFDEEKEASKYVRFLFRSTLEA